jgi:hypothetical protein
MFDGLAEAVRHRALVFLGSIPEGKNALITMLDSPLDDTSRALCIAGLIRVGSESEAAAYLANDPKAASNGAFLGSLAFGLWTGAENVDPVLRNMGSHSRWGPEWTSPAITQQLLTILAESKDLATQTLAIRVLNQANDRPEIRLALLEHWRKAEGHPQLAIALMENRFVWRSEPEVRAVIRKLSESDNRRVSLRAILQLAGHSDSESVSCLIRHVQSGDYERMVAAIKALEVNGAVLPIESLTALRAVELRMSRDSEAWDLARRSADSIHNTLHRLQPK